MDKEMKGTKSRRMSPKKVANLVFDVFCLQEILLQYGIY